MAKTMPATYDGVEYNGAEAGFLNEFTRSLLVEWCKQQIMFGELPAPRPDRKDRVFLLHAIKKNWVSADGKRVISAGFNAAASFLRR